MATEILLPQWDMEMQEGTVIKWLKKEGEPVQEGEPLVEIETAKLETEMESIASGIVAQILVPEGTTVPIRTALAIVAAPGEQVSRPSGSFPSVALEATAPSAAAQPRSDGQQGRQIVPAARRLAQQQDIDLSQVQGTGPGGRVLLEDVQTAMDSCRAGVLQEPQVQVVPAARRLASQHGIDLAQVKGTGPRGRILIREVERLLEAPTADYARVVPLTGMRATIANRMLQSTLTMAQVTLTTEADVTDGMRLREGLSRHLPEGSIGPLHLVIKATARALKEHPRMNAIQRENEIELVEEVNLGVAVAMDEGLIVPTVRKADQKTLAEIASEARELAEKAREGTASYDEVTGGTFTITNLGAYDIDAFTPIINPPQVGILGVGRVADKPAVHQGEITRRSMMFLSLTFDHRVIDGAPAAEFLKTVKPESTEGRPWGQSLKKPEGAPLNLG